MNLNPNYKKKNRVQRNSLLNNNVKSCVINIAKPLQQKKDTHNAPLQVKTDNKTGEPHVHKVVLKVAKNYGFGNYFNNLREKIIDKFLNYDEFISFEGMMQCQSLPELFNFRKEKVGGQSIDKVKNISEEYSYNKFLPSTREDEKKRNQKRDRKGGSSTNNEEEYLFNKSKHRDHFSREDEEYLRKYVENKENNSEIENLKWNLKVQRTKLINEYDLPFLKNEKINGPINWSKTENLSINESIPLMDQLKENSIKEDDKLKMYVGKPHSRMKVIKLNKVKEYCSKNKTLN